MLRIAIVNHLPPAIDALRRVVLGRPGYEIAWIARDGVEAVRKCAQDRPDLILMDLMMPVMDGAAATCKIMRETPCAILVVTPTVEAHAASVFEAMGCGALDAVATPASGPGQQIQGEKELLAKIERISRLIQKPPTRQTDPRPVGYPGPPNALPPLIAIGSSAGGPKALSAILGAMPARLGAAVIVVQHVDGEFAASLADWLKSQTPLPVRLAAEGSAPAAETVLVVAGDRHMVLTSELRLRFSPEPRDSVYRPSIDAFFSSLTRHWPRKDLAILLTGMGKDGAQGLLQLRRDGWHTIAQDQATSVAYGMPKAAADLDAATEIFPLPDIPRAIMDFLRKGKGKNA